MTDVDQIIFRARCAAITTLNGTMQDAIAKALETIAQTQPTLTIGHFTVARLHLKQVDISAPDNIYFAAKREKLDTLDHR